MANDSGKSPLARGKVAAGPIVSSPRATEPRAKYADKADQPAQGTRRAVSGEERRLMICEAAYYVAERRGFEAGHETHNP